MPAPVYEAIVQHLTRERELGGYEAADEAQVDIERVYTDVARVVGGVRTGDEDVLVLLRAVHDRERSTGDVRIERTAERTGAPAEVRRAELDRARIDGPKTTRDADGRRCVRGACDVSTPATPDQRAVVATLRQIPRYAQLFAQAFPDGRQPMTSKHVGDALIAFERGLAAESRWDRYVRGEAGALSAAERHGLKAFLEAGCQSCHSGPDLGGTMFQKLGAVIPWPHQTGATAGKAPSGDRPVKVRALKVAALYARYFRDSTSTRLRDTIEKMGYHQLGIQLGDEEIAAIVTWMQSLTGELDAAYVAPPDPPSQTNIADLP